MLAELTADGAVPVYFKLFVDGLVDGSLERWMEGGDLGLNSDGFGVEPL